MPKINFKLSLFLFFLVSSGQALQTSPDVQASNRFSFSFYKKIASKKSNLIVSPFSIRTALAMPYAGSRKETELQMRSVLGFNSDQNKTHQSLSLLLGVLNLPPKPPAYALSIANALWEQKGYPFSKEFLNINSRFYSTDLKEVDFAKPETARSLINQWVSEKTQKKIPELLEPGSIKRGARLVLTNAIYFKASWASPFEKEQITPGAFLVTENKRVEVPFLSKTHGYLFAENERFLLAELPYQGEFLSMVILIPKSKADISKWEPSLKNEELELLLQDEHMRELEISFPKFKFNSLVDGGSTLAVMGMPDAFSAKKANFSAMTSAKTSDNFFISSVIHKAFIEVDENGTEAAAATAVTMLGAARISKPIPFRADRPFLFFIRHRITGAILFLGKVVDPSVND